MIWPESKLAPLFSLCYNLLLQVGVRTIFPEAESGDLTDPAAGASGKIKFLV
jgi:hypothetical protein